MNKRGWFHESRRHSLAARGIRTVFKKSVKVPTEIWAQADEQPLIVGTGQKIWRGGTSSEDYARIYRLSPVKETELDAMTILARIDKKDKFFWNDDRLEGVTPNGIVYNTNIQAKKVGEKDTQLYVPDSIKSINNVERKEFLRDIGIENHWDEVWEAKGFNNESEANRHIWNLRRKIVDIFNGY